MKEIPLTQGKVALVDDEDYVVLKLFNWNFYKSHNVFYAVSNLPTKPDKTRGHIKMHRLVMDSPQGYEVDHIDGNGLNNQKSNLRIVTHRENAQNLHMDKASKYPGVTHSKRGLPWVSKIRIGRKMVNLGAFKTEEEAHERYIITIERIKNGLSLLPTPHTLNKSSVYEGVYWSTYNKRWCAVVKLKGDPSKRQKHIGSFHSEVEAHNAREEYMKNTVLR